VASGVALIVVVLLSAFCYVWWNPEGGDSWDTVYFFTHPAFFVLFAIGFTVGFMWRFRKAKSSTQLQDTAQVKGADNEQRTFDFKEENKMTTKGKVLVLVSSGHGLPLKDGKVYAGAGYYLNELTVPVRALMKEGYEITFSNPKGNTPQLDVNSAIAQFFGGDEAKLQDYLKFKDSLTGLKNPTRISDVIASGLDQYDAVFVPGGHGPMMDLLDDPDAGTVMRHFHETSKPTAVLCHGPISLLSALPNSKEVVAALAAGDAAGAHAKAQGWIYSGYKMTIFSTAEEQQREPLEIGGKVLFYPDFALRTAGGDVSVVAPWGSYVLQDRELISGQNPFSDEALLKLLLPALDGRKRSVSAA
jgi:putative intracellular protease/amidase